ncbi:beta-phosphoglucomutase family hydrolase [Pasteurellaceae bacterium 22721_9_1]
MLAKETLQNYTALIFDMDGTLIDTMPSHAKAWEKVGEVLGYPINGDLMYQLGGAPVSVIAKMVMQRYDIPAELLEEIIRLKRAFGFEMVEQNATLLPAFDIVKTYHHQFPMALGTGSHGNMVNLLLDKFNLRPYFDVIVDADQVTHHKPNPETFLRCAELLQVPPQHCLVFEDADFGIQASLNAGMDVFDVRIQQIIQAKNG